MLRAAVKAGTPIGRQAQEIMARGALVPDDVVVGIVEQRIAEADRLAQAVDLDMVQAGWRAAALWVWRYYLAVI